LFLEKPHLLPARAPFAKVWQQDRSGEAMQARDVMSTDVATVEGQATLLDAVKVLINAGATALPVVESDGVLIGMLSEFDVILRVLEGEGVFDLQTAPSSANARTLGLPVKSLMTSPAISVDEDTGLKAIADLMVKHRLRCVPVVRNRTVVGLVSRVDLVKALLSRSDAAPPAAARKVDDDQLRTDVIAAIRRLGLPLSGGFDVVARHGIVHLWGQVQGEEEHRRYQAAAAKIDGVTDVASHMQVRALRGLTGVRR
jgi:CBS domain-containing protein